MVSITVEENGHPKVITDIGPYVEERVEAGRRLDQFYAGFDEQSPEEFAEYEELIVNLVNRYNKLGHWIELFEAEKQRVANIRAGWDLVKQIRQTRT